METVSCEDRIPTLAAPRPGAIVLRLHAADLARNLPAWETAIPPGSVCIAVVEGDTTAWRALSEGLHDVAAELDAAPAVTIASVLGTAPDPGVTALLESFDLMVVGETGAATIERLVRRICEAPGPALVAAQLLRSGARIATESLAYSTLLGGESFHAWRARAPRRDIPPTPTRVRVELQDGVVVVRLSRPGRHNAFDAAMRELLCDALDAAAELAPAPVVLLGDGPSFCAGGDLDEFGLADDPVVAHVVRTGRSVARRLERLSDRLVVGVHGHCIGAGVEMAAQARTIVAAQGTSFLLPEIALGLSLGAGGAVSVPRRIGRRRTLELLLLAEPFEAPDALAWGLVDEIVPAGAVEDRCLAIARTRPGST